MTHSGHSNAVVHASEQKFSYFREGEILLAVIALAALLQGMRGCT